ncbi:MAG: hypothetical protein U9O78_02220 [Patescibacteria group bacterium]|nr:hypothetical protein [Patescibacteria group bacterium]
MTEDIQIGAEIQDLHQMPGVPEIRSKIEAQEISPERIGQLKTEFYPNFSDKEIVRIEKAAHYFFQMYSLLARWTGLTKMEQIKLSDFNVPTNSSLTERLKIFSLIEEIGVYQTAFASLNKVEFYLDVGDDATLTSMLDGLDNDTTPRLVDVGCGGQAADLQIAYHQLKKGKKAYVLGISAYDYGLNIRAAFSEFIGDVTFEQKNIYTDQIEGEADIAFSVRALPFTGMQDAVRFCSKLHDLAKEDGMIWLDGVTQNHFTFVDSDFKNLDDFLTYLQKTTMPSLRFRKKGINHTLRWKKEEGFPFADFVGKKIEYDEEHDIPYMVVYGLEQETI